MILSLSIFACALFDKQSIQEGRDPTQIEDFESDTGASQNEPSSEDTGSDTSSDTGGDTNDTGDSGPTNHMTSNNSDLAQSVDCDGEYSEYDYTNLEECFTDFLSCGDQILRTTGGGTTFYDNSMYTDWYNMNSKGADYEGSERAFYFLHPGDNSSAVVTLESPCEDMDLLYFRTYDLGECYATAASCPMCGSDNDLSDEDYWQDDTMEIFDTNPNSYLVIVESANNVDAPFVLTVDCN